MPDIAIEQSTFERLQRHAMPLVDTTDMVLNRALDALESQEGKADRKADPPLVKRRIDPRALPDLTHTKILDASLAGERVAQPKWNILIGRILVSAMKQLANFDEVRKLCPANIVQGNKSDEGYRHLSEIDVSVQGMSSNDACRALVAVAQSLGIGLEITLMWRPRDGAAYPGEKARLCVPGKPAARGATKAR